MSWAVFTHDVNLVFSFLEFSLSIVIIFEKKNSTSSTLKPRKINFSLVKTKFDPELFRLFWNNEWQAGHRGVISGLFRQSLFSAVVARPFKKNFRLEFFWNFQSLDLRVLDVKKILLEEITKIKILPKWKWSIFLWIGSSAFRLKFQSLTS